MSSTLTRRHLLIGGIAVYVAPLGSRTYAALLDGIAPQNFPHRLKFAAMPGFADKLTDEQAAALVNYLRATWGGQKPDVTAAAVRALR